MKKMNKMIKIGRIRHPHTKEPVYIIVEEELGWLLKGDVFSEFEKGEAIGKIDEQWLLPPVPVETVYGLGANHYDYADFLVEIGREQHDEPVIFTKPSESVVGMADRIIIPKAFKSCGIKGSGELGVILKKDCDHVSEEEAAASILGYTNVFDAIPANKYFNVTQEEKHAGKRFATFCPMGPYLIIGLDISCLRQRTYYNDLLMLDGYTDRYVWSVAQAIQRISELYPMKKGDAVIMGAMAPAEDIRKNHPEIFANGHLMAKDRVTVKTEGLGSLVMKIADEI